MGMMTKVLDSEGRTLAAVPLQRTSAGWEPTRPVYVHLRNERAVMVEIDEEFDPDSGRCSCGGSGWAPGVYDVDEPCPYHSEVTI